jgi:hypothetical protein
MPAKSGHPTLAVKVTSPLTEEITKGPALVANEARELNTAMPLTGPIAVLRS